MTHKIYEPEFPLKPNSNKLPLSYRNMGLDECMSKLRVDLYGREIQHRIIVEIAMSLALDSEGMDLASREVALDYIIGTLLESGVRENRVFGGSIRDSITSGAMYRQYLREICILYRAGVIQLDELERAAVIKELGPVFHGGVGTYVEKDTHPSHDAPITFVMAMLDDLLTTNHDCPVWEFIKALKRNVYRLLTSSKGCHINDDWAHLTEVVEMNTEATVIQPVEVNTFGSITRIRSEIWRSCSFDLGAVKRLVAGKKGETWKDPILSGEVQQEYHENRIYVAMNYTMHHTTEGGEKCFISRTYDSQYRSNERQVVADTLLLLAKFRIRTPDRYHNLCKEIITR